MCMYVCVCVLWSSDSELCGLSSGDLTDCWQLISL